MFDDLIDAAAAWTTVKGAAEIGEILFGASGNDFHGTVVGVADPAAEGKLAGFAVDEPAEADALDAAKDEVVTDHWKDSPLLILGPGVDLGETGCGMEPGWWLKSKGPRLHGQERAGGSGMGFRVWVYRDLRARFGGAQLRRG